MILTRLTRLLSSGSNHTPSVFFLSLYPAPSIPASHGAQLPDGFRASDRGSFSSCVVHCCCSCSIQSSRSVASLPISSNCERSSWMSCAALRSSCLRSTSRAEPELLSRLSLEGAGQLHARSLMCLLLLLLAGGLGSSISDHVYCALLDDDPGPPPPPPPCCRSEDSVCFARTDRWAVSKGKNGNHCWHQKWQPGN